jgi:hypothetical protein
LWQRFCCAKHRDQWHYDQKKQAAADEAEERVLRRNGGGGTKIDLEALGFKPAPAPGPKVDRRGL